MQDHRSTLPGEWEEQDLSVLLRGAMIDDEPQHDEAFRTRILRRWKVERSRKSIHYWTPAILGAAIASVALFALLQMLSQPQQLAPIRVLNGDAAQRFEPRQIDLPNAPSSSVTR